MRHCCDGAGGCREWCVFCIIPRRNSRYGSSCSKTDADQPDELRAVKWVSQSLLTSLCGSNCAPQCSNMAVVIGSVVALAKRRPSRGPVFTTFAGRKRDRYHAKSIVTIHQTNKQATPIVRDRACEPSARCTVVIDVHYRATVIWAMARK